MFGIAEHIALALGNRAKTLDRAADEEVQRMRDRAEYLDSIKRSAEQRTLDRIRHARNMADTRPQLFKLAATCTHCHSNDYLNHHGRVQCAYCRIPTADLPPQRPNPYTDPVQRANWEQMKRAKEQQLVNMQYGYQPLRPSNNFGNSYPKEQR